MATKKKVILEGEIKATIANAQEVTSKIQDFKKQLDALEMPKEATKAFSKAFDKVLKGLDEFEIKAGRGVSSLADTKDLERAWKAIVKNIDGLEVALRGLNAGDIFPKEVKNNIESAQKALDKYVKKLAEAKQSEAYKNKTKSKNDLIESKGAYEKELKNAKQRAIREEGKYEAQRKKWGETEQKQYEAQVKALEDKTKARDEYLKTQKKTEKEVLRDALQKQKYITKDPEARGGYRLNLNTARAIAGKEDSEEKEAARKKLEEAENVLGQLAAIYDKEKTMNEEIADASKIVKGLEDQKTALDEAEKEWKDAQSSVEIYTKKVEDAESAIKQVDSELETMSLDEAKKEWEAVVKVFQDLLGIDLSGIAQDAELVQKQLIQYQTDEVEKLPNIYELLKKALGAVGPAAKQAGEGVEGLNAEAKELSEAEKDINNLKRQLLDFFSISNAIELFKRAIRSAVDTVKELDTVMTETAVVTDFSIGDMWDKLPDYADKASDLGTSIAELYSATTLYYQQGLKTNEAMGVGVETMKMARIAAMDAEDATTAMTAALRGFNMEVNEMNAQRVSDVYSELAAISAADTNQIATAMGKTASIAASANMEFETTAAFLTQIIETTQEAPETAGTALKTIVARFTEVKELFGEGMLTGEDSEGEEININKIDEALRTVGISLKDFLNGSKGMDDIFLELASKWDSLDLATQRYIATAAAGSRQQSRFIAMMSNYGRTMELVDAANNSAGASQEQYAKTLESLDTKLQQLKNAWDTFAMGLANDETIKVAVDTLTWILEKINLIIEGISGGNGMIKSLTSLGAAFGALKVGGTTFEALFGTVAKAASEGGLGAGETFSSVFQSSLKEKFGKSGEYFKKLFPSRKQWKTLVGQDLTTAFAFDFNNASSGQIKHFGESIWKDFETSLIGQKIKLTELDQLKKEFFEGFESGNAEKSLQNLAEKADELKVNFELSKESAKATTSTIESGFGKASAAVAGVSLALTAVTKLLESSGHERGAEGFEALAGGASVLAGILTVLPGLLKAFGVAASAAGPIGWAIAAITGLISLCVALEKWIENDAEKLERLNKEAQEAADAAKEAREAYEELASTQNDYKDLQKGLEDLIKGTEEWRRKLVETNDQVLELLQNYPILSDYIGRGEDGQLIITEAGWSALEEQQLSRMENTRTRSIMAKAYAQNQEAAALTKNGEFTNKFRNYVPTFSSDNLAKVLQNAEMVTQAYGELIDTEKLKTLNDEQKKQLWKAIGQRGEYDEDSLAHEVAYGEYYMLSSAFVDFAKEVDMDPQALYKSKKVLQEYLPTLKASRLQSEQTLATYIKTSETVSGSKYGDQIAESVASNNLKEIGYEIEKETTKLLQESRGSLEEKYKDLTGLETEGKADKYLATAIAEIEVGERIQEKANNIVKNLGKIKDEAHAKTVAAAITGNLGEFTRDEVNNINVSKDTIKEAIVNALGGDDAFGELLTSMGMDEDQYFQWLEDMFSDFDNRMDELFTGDIQKIFGNVGKSSLLQDATYNQQKVYADFLTNALGQLGTNEANSLRLSLNKLLSDVSTRDEVFKLLGSTNFQKEGSAQEFIADLERIGVDMSRINIDSFVQDLDKLGVSFRKIDLKSLMDQAKELLDLSDDLKDRDAEKGLTDEEREKLLTVPGIKEEDFAWTGQEWVYLGDTMEGLSRALRENTEAILEQKMTSLEEQIATGENLEKIFGDDNSVGFKGSWGWLSTGGWGQLTESMSLEEFLKGKEGSLTADIIRKIFGEEAGATDTEAWALFDKYKFAYENLTGNKNTYDLYSQNMGTAIAMSGYLGQSKGTGEDYEKAVAAKERILGTEQLAKTLEGLFDSGAKKAVGFDTAIRALAADLGASQRNMKGLVETLGDVKDSLTKGKRGTEEYSSAWQKVEDSLKSVFGADALEGVDISQELMEKLASGSEDAFAEVERLVQANAQKSLEAIVKQTKGTLDGLQAALPELQANIKTTYNSGQLTEIFGEIITQADETAAEARARIAEDLLGLGFQVAWSLDKEGKVTAAQIVNIDRGNLFKNYSSSSGGSSSKWENPYDKLHNTVQRINAELRTRERLERQYQRILENEAASSAELAENARKQIESLEYEKRTREYLVQKREEELAMIQDEYKDVSNYATWDDTLGVILNQEALAALNGSTDEKLTGRVEKYIEKMQEKFDQIQEEVDAIDEIDDTVKDIKIQGQQEYLNFEDEIKQALIAERQKEIDQLTAINDSINNSKTKIIESMQKSIDLQRQIRENSKTEKDLEEKRQRLLQLQMDTSGANDLEIMALEEELADEEQSFIDTLVDQKIQQLQDQNQEAYEQRQHQIELMQDQLRIWEESGDIWTEVNSIFRDGFDSLTGEIDPNSKLMQILKASSDFDSKSQAAQEKWLEELNQTLTQALGYLEMNQQLEDIGMKAGTSIEFYYNGEKLEGIVDKNGNVVTADGKVYNNVYKGLGGYYAGENINEQRKEVEEEKLYKNNSGDKNGSAGSSSKYKSELSQDQIKQVQNELNALGYNAGAADGIYGKNTMNAINRLQRKPEGTEQILTAYVANQIHELFLKEHGIFEPESRKLFPGYATGGLADFTGPAWLDGTKAKPEYVLNAAQTERFFTLVDILDSLKGFENGKSIQNSGDNIVDIDINIDTVKEEADVDMLAEKVQRAIVTSAQYRNNNFVRR